MNDLLEVAVSAHGGLEMWNQLKTVKASLSITGAIWQVKGIVDIMGGAPGLNYAANYRNVDEIVVPDETESLHTEHQQAKDSGAGPGSHRH